MDEHQLPAAPPAAAPPVPAPPAERLSIAEINAALRRPIRLVDLTLGAPERIAANVTDRHALGLLAGCLLLIAALAPTVRLRLR